MSPQARDTHHVEGLEVTQIHNTRVHTRYTPGSPPAHRRQPKLIGVACACACAVSPSAANAKSGARAPRMATVARLLLCCAALVACCAPRPAALRLPRPAQGRYRNPRVKPAWYRQRQRALTPAQKRAEQALWPQWGLSWSYGDRLDLDARFGRAHADGAPGKLCLEVGCGTGEALAALALARPQDDFVGVDWYRGGLASALQKVDALGLTNVRVARADALLLLDVLPQQPLFDEVLVYFPDPWRGSLERRMVRAEVTRALWERCRPGARLRLATDVADYPAHARAVLASAEGGHWRELPSSEAGLQEPGASSRPSTKYERAAIDEGRTIADLCFEAVRDPKALGRMYVEQSPLPFSVPD